eukprot:2080484-Amphidinium_carterae.1
MADFSNRSHPTCPNKPCSTMCGGFLRFGNDQSTLVKKRPKSRDGKSISGVEASSSIDIARRFRNAPSRPDSAWMMPNEEGGPLIYTPQP